MIIVAKEQKLQILYGFWVDFKETDKNEIVWVVNI